MARAQFSADVGALTTFAAAIVSLAAAYFVTHSAGGTHTVFPHFFYVPVLLVALKWGPVAGGSAGVVAGIACGPLMPLHVDVGQAQELGGWLTRTGFFIGIGVLSGGIAQRMYQRHQRSEQFHRDAIHALVNTIDAKSSFTARHSERVARFATMTAHELEMPQWRCDDLHWAGLVHDIGKLWISDHVINKEGPLTDDEWELIKQHPVLSEQFLRDVHEFQPYLAAVRGHHERYDGNGYPDRLAGEQIPLDARILAVADAFEAMTVDRPYRPALTYAEALIEIEHNAGKQFDPEIARVFCAALREQLRSPASVAQLNQLSQQPAILSLRES